MKTISPQETTTFMTISNTGCKINEISLDNLIRLYQDTHFIYDGKAKRLAPYLPLILKNWNKALNAGAEIVRIVTYEGDRGHMASVMMWKYTDNTWNVQHLVSNGGHISHIPMLSVKGSLLTDPQWQDLKYLQCWYRPDNKLPQLCFGESLKSIGPDKMSLTNWNYYECNRIENYYSKNIQIVDGSPSNFEAFKIFFKSQGDGTWWQSERFNPHDLELNELNEEYEKVGLNRSRKILLAYQYWEELPSAVAICNLAPVGMNLSFLENRTILLFRGELSRENKTNLVHALLQRIKKVYQHSELLFIPLLVEDHSNEILQNAFQFPFFKKYNQSIWGEPAFLPWYTYIENLFRNYSAPNSKLNPAPFETSSR